jgi:adenylate cyclase
MVVSTLYTTLLSFFITDIPNIQFVLVCAPTFGVLIHIANQAKSLVPKRNFIWGVFSSSVIYFVCGSAALLISYKLLESFRVDQTPWPPISSFVRSQTFASVMYTVFGGIICVSLIDEFSRKLGPGILPNLIMGRYYKPREEERIFMFLDMKDSTTHAETLTNLQFSSLIQEFMRDLSGPIQTNKAEVSHYIGDSAVICWKMKRGIERNRCVQLFFDFEEVIRGKAKAYRDRYGFVPGFKAAVHGGQVVTTEVGEIKSEIVFHGDVLNTTARLESLCGQLGHDLLISDELCERLSLGDFMLSDLGEQSLKGRKETIGVVGVRRKSQN